MATVDLTVQTLSDAGVTPNYQAAASGNTYRVPNQHPVLLHVKNTNAGICTVTFTAGAVGGQRKSVTKTVAVPATTGEVVIGPFDPDVFIDKANPGKVTFTVSVGSGVTVAVYQSPLVDQRRS